MIEACRKSVTADPHGEDWAAASEQRWARHLIRLLRWLMQVDCHRPCCRFQGVPYNQLWK
jgi:hypothetical protein